MCDRCRAGAQDWAWLPDENRDQNGQPAWPDERSKQVYKDAYKVYRRAYQAFWVRQKRLRSV